MSAATEYIAVAGGPGEAAFMAALSAEADPIERTRMAARNSRETWESGAMELELMVFDRELRHPRLVELRHQGLAHKLASTRAVCEIPFPDSVRRPGFDIADVAAFAVTVDSACPFDAETARG